MEKIYTWEIKVKNTPLLKRKCNHCDSERFYCSEKFRMNAQKRNIDVWLIYRCIKCDSTYNLTILSRTKPELINNNLYSRFSANDAEKSWEYAFSTETLRRNNADADWGSVEYDVLHDHLSIGDILNPDAATVTFKIKCDYEFHLKLSAVIRQCLNLSVSQLDKWVEAGVISISSNISLKKYKVKDGDMVQVDKVKLRSFLEKR